MISVLDGFDTEEISIDPDTNEVDDYQHGVYRYPEDFDRVQWLIEEIQDNRKYVDEALMLNGFDTNEIIGFIPLYFHRALVVYKDKSLSPVISIHQGRDVIVYGKDLEDYWEKEFEHIQGLYFD